MSEIWKNNVGFEKADVWAQVVKIPPRDTHTHYLSTAVECVLWLL